MPDISMCGDTECPSKAECYRFMAEAGNFQTYSVFDRKGADRCPSFIEYWGNKHQNTRPHFAERERCAERLVKMTEPCGMCPTCKMGRGGLCKHAKVTMVPISQTPFRRRKNVAAIE